MQFTAKLWQRKRRVGDVVLSETGHISTKKDGNGNVLRVRMNFHIGGDDEFERSDYALAMTAEEALVMLNHLTDIFCVEVPPLLTFGKSESPTETSGGTS